MHKFDSWGYNERNEAAFDILPNKYQQKTVLKEYEDKKERKYGKLAGHVVQVRAQGLVNMTGTMLASAPFAVYGGYVGVVFGVGAIVTSPYLLNKKKYYKELKEESIENFELSAFSCLSFVSSPVKHVIAPEYFYRPKKIKTEHPLYQSSKIEL